MPTYLCRAFRWRRQSIRVYVVVQDLDDAAPEWVIKRGSAQSLIASFYNLFDFLPERASPPARSGDSGTRHCVPASPDYTTHTVQSGSKSQGRAAAAQHDQGPYYNGPNQDDPQGPRPRRESSIISRKRGTSELTQASGTPSTHGSSAPQTNNPESPSAPSQPPIASSSNKNKACDLVLTQDWSPIKLLEEYDPNNLEECSRPYAYVADYVKRIDASCSIDEEVARYEQQVQSSFDPAVTGRPSGESSKRDKDTARSKRSAEWFEQLRDQLQRDEEIRWYVVVNGDEERAWPMGGTGSRPDTRAQTAPRAQYVHQQSTFEGHGEDIETRRQQLRRELGYDEGVIDELEGKKPEMKPETPETERLERLPSGADSSIQPGDSSDAKIPKTPRKAFRFVFGKSKGVKKSF